MFTQPINKIETELVDGLETTKEVETDRFEVYQAVEKTALDDSKVVIKELVGSYTKSEVEADIANLANAILDLQNQKRDKEQILSEFNK